MHSIFLTQNKILGRKTFQPDLVRALIPLETSMKNPAVADRAFVGLGHVYVARAESRWVPPFPRPEKCLSPSLAALRLRLSDFKPQRTYLALQHSCTKEMVHNLLHSMNLPVSS